LKYHAPRSRLFALSGVIVHPNLGTTQKPGGNMRIPVGLKQRCAVNDLRSRTYLNRPIDPSTGFLKAPAPERTA
jgi:hypothetical protein